eukprot:m.2803 g.2803  ORF g.2803 m.2803 type:complete len:666 (-) comp4099_c0_seq1:969-2966(-)
MALPSQIGALFAITRRCSSSLSSLYRVSSEVKAALAQKQPVVALESTIISHGMPYPSNLETALSVEAAVRSEGAIPATIAIIEGQVCVGMSQAQIEALAQPDAKVAKVSRRNYARVLAARGLGSTTVAATMLACHHVGIDIFATGGIGGVHREGQDSMDISADLMELGKTRVGVVCAGVKSILDIPRTLEVLETQGVLVATVGSQLEFPAFFSRRSGSNSVAALSEEECAETLAIQAELQLDAGCVFACPIPDAHDMGTAIDDVIEQELDKAKTLGVRGKDVTPHLLAAVNTATKGASLQANVALIHNNARVAARIARHLSQVTARRHASTQASAVVMGGATVDTTAHSMTPLVAGSTAYGHVEDSHGGVARNIAQGLGQLGLAPRFATTLGDDQAGHQVQRQLEGFNIEMLSTLLPTFSTARYIATLSSSGDLVHAVADMGVFDQLADTLLQVRTEILRQADVIVLDGNAFDGSNSSAPLVDSLHQIDTPLWLEPTSTTRAKALAPLLATLQPRFISPDLNEFDILTASMMGLTLSQPTNPEPRTVIEMLDEISTLLPTTGWVVTMGEAGVVAPNPAGLRQLMSQEPVIKPGNYQHYPAHALTQPLLSVTGAGDSMVAGMVASLILQQYSTCVAVGLEAARLSLQSTEAIAPELTSALLVNSDT